MTEKELQKLTSSTLQVVSDHMGKHNVQPHEAISVLTNIIVTILCIYAKTTNNNANELIKHWLQATKQQTEQQDYNQTKEN